MRKGIIVFTLFLVVFVSAGVVVMADTNDNNLIIDDSSNYFTEKEIEYIEKIVIQLPETYRFYILPSLTSDSDINFLADSLFDIKKFSQDTIFILVVTDERKIHITTGDALQKKELNEEFFNNEIIKYFIPTVISKNDVAQGLAELAIGISKDIPLYLETSKTSVAIPEVPAENQNVDENKKSSFIQIILWVGLMVVFLLALWLVVKIYFSKRK